jgi:hypothetical protein
MKSFSEWLTVREYSTQGATDDIPLTVQNNISMRKNRSDTQKPEIRSKYEAMMKKTMKKDK